MTTIQVKTEIEQTLDRMPEELLPYILDAACLLKSDLDISASEDEKYDFTIAASTGDIRFEEIKSWLEERLIYK